MNSLFSINETQSKISKADNINKSLINLKEKKMPFSQIVDIKKVSQKEISLSNSIIQLKKYLKYNNNRIYVPSLQKEIQIDQKTILKMLDYRLNSKHGFDKFNFDNAIDSKSKQL